MARTISMYQSLIETADLRSPELKLLFVLASLADDNGEAFASYNLLLRKTGNNFTNVSARLKVLQEKGLVEVVRGDHSTHNKYKLLCFTFGQEADAPVG